MSILHNQALSAKDIIVVANARAFQDDGQRPLGVGDIVRLNSGSPPCIVVDILSENRVCIARRNDGAAIEHDLPVQCLHRLGAPSI